jgi:hypothetical protein
MRASNQAGRWPLATIGNEVSVPRSEMNIMRQQKQRKGVVEHKGVYPRLGSTALIHLLKQSLTWDTLCSDVSRISLVAVYLQLIQQLAWDTLSHLRISDEIAGILITFYFARVLRPVGRHSQEIWRIRRKFLSRTVAKVPTEKKLSRCGFLVAYRVEGLEMSNDFRWRC